MNDQPHGEISAFSALRKLSRAATSSSTRHSKKSSISVKRKPDLQHQPVTEACATDPKIVPQTQGSTLYNVSQARHQENPTQFSSPDLNWIYSGDKVTLSLRPGQQVVLLGSYGLLLQGSSGEIYLQGARIRPSPSEAHVKEVHWIHAPLSHALPAVECISAATIDIVSHPAASTLRQLSNLSPLFRRLWDEHNLHKTSSRPFTPIVGSEDFPPRITLRTLDILPQWRIALEDIVKNYPLTSRYLVCGPQNSGKSTFAKLFCNTMLSHLQQTKPTHACTVAYMDLDPGQSEYLPSGNVSLVLVRDFNLGPSFTHPIPPSGKNSIIRAHSIAAVSLNIAPQHYLDCVRDLFDAYKQQVPDVPLIINTAGWVVAGGLEILTKICHAGYAQKAIFMSVEGHSHTVSALTQAMPDSHVIQLQPQLRPSCSPSRSGLQLRQMQAMAYYHAILAQPETPLAYQMWDPAPLSQRPPSLISYRATPLSGGISSNACDGVSSSPLISLIWAHYSNPAPSDLASMLIGRTVAIVEVDAAAIPEHVRACVRTDEGLPYVQSPRLLPPSCCATLGNAIVHDINPWSQDLLLRTPVNLSDFQSVWKRNAVHASNATHMESEQDGLANASAKQTQNEKDKQKLLQSEEKKNIVLGLVVGRMDTPDWLYREDIHFQNSLGAAALRGTNSAAVAHAVKREEREDRRVEARARKVEPVVIEISSDESDSDIEEGKRIDAGAEDEIEFPNPTDDDVDGDAADNTRTANHEPNKDVTKDNKTEQLEIAKSCVPKSRTLREKVGDELVDIFVISDDDEEAFVPDDALVDAAVAELAARGAVDTPVLSDTFGTSAPLVQRQRTFPFVHVPGPGVPSIRINLWKP